MKKNTIDEQYIDLLKDILENGVEKNTRSGKVLSVFGRSIRYKFKDGKFPLLTTKKMYFKGIITELLWFLRGETNIRPLVLADCHIWDGDTYQAYQTENKELELCIVNSIAGNRPEVNELLKKNSTVLSKEEFIERIKTDPEFAEKWGDLGPIYGKQWRKWSNPDLLKEYVNKDGREGGDWTENHIDQIKNSINLLRTDPDSRRNIVSAWNVAELGEMILPPCHMMFQFYTRELTFEERWNLAKERGMVGKDAIMPTPDAIYLNLNERREMESLWNDPAIKADLPKRAISLMWYQRSCDVPLGLPFNIASYGLLLELFAKMVNMVPDELIGNLGDTHIYLNQVDGVIEQIGKLSWEERKEMLTDPKDIKDFGNISPFTENMIHGWLDYKNIPYSKRMPFELPSLRMGKTDAFYKSLSDDFSLITHLDPEDFGIENYTSHPTIKFPLSN